MYQRFGLYTLAPWYHLLFTSITRCILHKNAIHLSLNMLTFLVIWYFHIPMWSNLWIVVLYYCYVNSVCIYLYERGNPLILAGISDVICSLYAFYTLKTITLETLYQLFLKIMIDEYLICVHLNHFYHLDISISSHMIGYVTGLCTRIIYNTVRSE